MKDCCNHKDHIRQKGDPPGYAGEAFYTCPMHPEITKNDPGMCPECGMALVRTRKGGKKKKKGYDKHAGHSTKMFLRKFWASLILAIPIIIYSELPGLFLGWEAPVFPGSNYLGLVFGSLVFFYGGWAFLAGAWRELRALLPGMMTLIGLATSAAYLWSVYAVFAGAEPLFWELATLITIMLLGHYLEMKAVQGARGALRELAKLLPDKAELIRGDKIEMVSVGSLKIGDLVLVKPGGKIPADGRIIEGKSELNESIVTGESKLVLKKPGDEVIAGTINSDGSLKVEVLKVGDDTFLAGVMRLVEAAQASKSRLQILSDKAALILTIVAVLAGGITLAAWLLAGAEIAFAVARLVAVLVIACPHALGLAVPLVASISTNMAASNGFIVKRRIALEAAREIDIVLFDKTGTLTKGEFGVSEIITNNSITPNDVLKIAASVNSHSEHPLAKAMLREAAEKGIALEEVKDFQRIPGKGVQGNVDGKEVLVGSSTLLEENNIQISEDDIFRIRNLESEGKTINHVMHDKIWLGALAMTDVVRGESKEAITKLHEAGIKVAMITGDSDDAAKWVSGELGIDEYFTRVLPHEKSEKVKKLQDRGLKVAMVGDGVNDAPALMQADLGIAIGAGTNVAIESAGIILARNDPRDIPKILNLSRMTYRKMIQNLFWATGYNVVALPLGAGVLYNQGVILEPALAAVLMSVSTVIVAANAMLMKRNVL